MQPMQKFSLVAKSAILTADKPNRGLDAIESKNPNQMNRIRGYLPDGREVMVAHRGGKGGMDFNKILGGKAYAVAADAFSPVYEKENGKKTNKQKTEDGLPLYSTSGFYLLSSKDYPALRIFEAYLRLDYGGELAMAITDRALEAAESVTLESDMDLDFLFGAFESLLGDERNYLARFDEAMNRKRQREITRAKQDAENEQADNPDEASELAYQGVEFRELAVNPKDGSPFVLAAWQAGDGTKGSFELRRTVDFEADDGRLLTRTLPAAEAIARFQEGPDAQALAAVVDAGQSVTLTYVVGFVFRTSVSFRRKVENINSGAAKATHGDGVFIRGALERWTRSICAVMHSMHPNFPQADYDCHHYVLACRQSEVGMDRQGERYSAPTALGYDLPAHLLRAAVPA